jgi:AraC-like DNA-binding protein
MDQRSTARPVERQLFRNDTLGVGLFRCAADDQRFPITDPLMNDLFVFANEPLWWNRGHGDWGFLEPGSVVMHRKGSAIQRRAVTAAGDRADFVAVSPDLFEEVLISAGASPVRVTTMLDAIIPDPKTRAAQRRFTRALRSGELDALSTEEQVLMLFERLATTVSGTTIKPAVRFGTQARHRRLTDLARAYVHANLDENLDLAKIAKEIGTSVFHLCRLFREQIGMTLSTYRMQQRVGLAADRLLEDQQDLAGLAVELGFSSHSHLSRSFRRYLDVPPSSFKANSRPQAAVL